MSETNGKFDTVIGADATFKGELEFEKDMQVLGRFEGRIASKGNLHVAEGGKLKADVTAGNVQIDGEIKGNIAATGKVLLKSSARLEGDLETARLEVSEGAVFIGNCRVGPQNKGTNGSASVQPSKAASKSAEPAKSKSAEPARK